MYHFIKNYKLRVLALNKSIVLDSLNSWPQNALQTKLRLQVYEVSYFVLQEFSYDF